MSNGSHRDGAPGPGAVVECQWNAALAVRMDPVTILARGRARRLHHSTMKLPEQSVEVT
jgi:hypothetical protein